MPDNRSTAASASDEGLDPEFAQHLLRGSELLQAGDPATARTLLEHALRLQPRNERGQNLLALTYFKLGLFERAEELYGQLVAEHPRDATLRMNLALTLLKLGRAEDATLAFLAALEIDPGHRKSQNYLGLTYLQLRDYARAREWFDKAGNAAMSARAALAAAASPSQHVGEGGAALLEGGEPTLAPAEAAGPRATPRPDEAPELVAFSKQHRVESLRATPFAVTPALVAIDVKAGLLARVDGLVASFGRLEVKAAFKRFRGQLTEMPFGEPSRRMMSVAGHGRLWIAAQERRFAAVEMGDEPAYFQEEALFAFEESLLFENGRVPSRFSGDLQLVHLRGRGRALLVSKHRVRSLEVTPDERVRVPLERLLGWHGNLAPSIVALAEDPAADAVPLAAVELTGAGRVLLDAPL
jgi:Tfp pilus assembly protein PilF/uncharacterized protein (AIM24 family)